MRLRGFPVLILFIVFLGMLMLLPALAAGLEREWRAARLFLFSGVFVMAAAAALGVAARARRTSDAHAREELSTLLGAFTVAPAFAATPIYLLAPELGWSGAYFEAVACLTTTGASVLPLPETKPESLHLWRALLGWTGGLTTLSFAVAVLAPRELLDLPGGASAAAARMRVGRILALGPGGRRMLRAIGAVAPIYLGLTAAAAALLASTGVPSFFAFSHAMGLVSTSGISPLPGALSLQENRMAELVTVVFLVLAMTRLTYGRSGPTPGPGAARTWASALRDPEIQLMGIAIGAATIWLFVHGVLVEKDGPMALALRPIDTLQAFWGGLVTSVGFLSTSGYVSSDWAEAVAWTRVEAPSLMLMGLATLGGGVATTCGGVKLFRAFALYRHGAGELARLPHPSMVDTARTSGGSLSRQAIVNAWVYVMLYMTAAAACLLALTLTGLDFDAALAGAVASMSNTGPLFPLASGATYAGVPESARWVMLCAMVLGRIEVLAAVALCNPSYWRS